MDLTGFFQAIQGGGPDVIFVLSVLVVLFLTGEIRVKREVEDRDKVITALEKRNEELGDRNKELGERYDTEHALFQGALSLIRDDMLPMLRGEGTAPRGSRDR